MNNKYLILFSLLFCFLYSCKDKAKTIPTKPPNNTKQQDEYQLDKKILFDYVKENDMTDDNLIEIESSFMPTLMELKNKNPEEFNQLSVLIFLKIYDLNIKGNGKPSFRIFKESYKYSSLYLLYSGFLDISDDYKVNSSIENVYQWAQGNKDQITLQESIIQLKIIESALNKT